MADVTITCSRTGNCIIEATSDVGKKFLDVYAWRMKQGENAVVVSKEGLDDWLEIFKVNEISYDGIQ